MPYGRGGRSHVRTRGNEVDEEKEIINLLRKTYEFTETEPASTEPAQVGKGCSAHIS